MKNKIKDLLKNNKKNFYNFFYIGHIFDSKSNYILKDNTIYEIKSTIYELSKKEIELKYGKDFFINLKNKKKKLDIKKIDDFYKVKISKKCNISNIDIILGKIYSNGEIVISNNKNIYIKYNIKNIFKDKKDFFDIFENIEEKKDFIERGTFSRKQYINIFENIEEKFEDNEKRKINIYLSLKTLNDLLLLIEDYLIFIIENRNEKIYIDILKKNKNKKFIINSLNLKENQIFKGFNITGRRRNNNYKLINKSEILNIGMSNNSGQPTPPKWYRKKENKVIKNNIDKDIKRNLTKGDYENIVIGKYVKNASYYF